MFTVPEPPEHLKGWTNRRAMRVIDRVANETLDDDFEELRVILWRIMNSSIGTNPHRRQRVVLEEYQEVYERIDDEELQTAMEFLKWKAENPIQEFL